MQKVGINTYEDMPTPVLKEKIKAEWERVSQLLIKIYPISHESFQMMLRDLTMMNNELDKREDK